jgi:ferredoxin
VSWRVVVDLDRCQGYANCVVAAPEIFDIDEATGTAILLQEAPDETLLSAVEDAVRQCPAEAISLER